MRIDAKNQVQYVGPDSTEAKDKQTKSETSLGIGGTKDSFEITDGTSKDLPGGRLMQQGIILQKDKDVDPKDKSAFADGSVLVGNDLQSYANKEN